MTKKELEKEATEYATEWGDKTDGTYACCRDGYLAGAEPREKRIVALEKENAELKERHAEILEAFASASSGDDFEMAESAREIMEILDIPCYRHGKVVSKLTKAKEIIKKFLDAKNIEDTCVAESEAEHFLQELSELQTVSIDRSAI